MTADDAARGYAAMYREGFDWRNEVAARIMLTFGLYSPGREAGKVSCPTVPKNSVVSSSIRHLG